MKSLFSPHPVIDFGPDTLHSFMPPAQVHHISGRRSSVLRSQVRQFGPKKPGVYGMLDRHGELIYIGKAKYLRSRLLSYFRPRSRDPKAGRILSQTAHLAWQITPNEFAALHRELELIRRWRPRFNVQGQPHARRPTYICLGRKPAPYAFLARRPPRDVLAFYGPIPAGLFASEAVRWLNDCFLLRDCPQSQQMIFAEQRELFPLERSAGCVRYEIGTCLGPCAAGCTRREYFQQIRAVRAFLEGNDQSILFSLQSEMETAAARHLFEKAAVLRDKYQLLTWLYQKLEQMRQLERDGSFIYPLRGHDGETLWYLIHAGQTVAALPEPDDKPSRQTAAALIDTVYQKQFACSREQTLARRDSILLVSSWFCRYPQERERTMSPEEAAEANW